MPDLSSNLSTLRTSGHYGFLWLAVFAGTEVYSATVSAIDNEYTTSTLTITSGSGTVSDIVPGMEVRVYNSSGDYKGSVRVRRSGTISASSIPINETAKGTVEIVAGDTISIVDDHRLRPVFPDSTTDFDPDKETYTNQTEVIDPVACSGGHTAQFVDPGQNYATVDFPGSGSFALDPNSGGTLTHSWEFGASAAPTTSTSADPTGVQMPVGDNVVKHTVTDSSNSKTYTQYVYCGVFDNNTQPYRVNPQTLSLSGTENEGWEMTFSLMAGADLDAIPDGAWVVLFADEYFAGSQQSFGNRNSERSHIKFVGVLRNDTTTKDGQQGENNQTYTAVSPIQVLREMAGFSQYFDSQATATSWQEIEALSIKTVIVHLLRTYTTALDMMDFYYEADDYEYPVLSFQKDTPYAQMMYLVEGLDARLSSDRTCNLAVQKRQEFHTLATRSALTTAVTFAEQDIMNLSFDRLHHFPVRLLEGRAILTASGALAGLRSHWPSRTPGEGAQDSVIDWILISSQDDLNTKTGLHGAKLNSVFIDTNGYQQRAPRLVFETRFDALDFYKEWIALSLDATSNWHGIDLSSMRWILRQCDITYEFGAPRVTLTLDAETAGPPGQTYIPPAEDGLQFPEIEIPSIEWIPPADPGPYPVNLYTYETGDAAAVLANGKIATTDGWDGAAPPWTENDHSATLGSSIVTYATDASGTYFTSGSGSGTVPAWVASRTNIYHISDIFLASPTIANQHTLATTSTSDPTLDADFIFSPGSKAVLSYDILNNKHVAVRTSDGSTWAEADIQGTTGLGNLAGTAWVFYSTNTADLVYCYAADDVDTAYTLWQSTNNGQTWSIVDGGLDTLDVGGNRTQRPKTLYFPFRGAGDQFCWFGHGTDGFYIGDTSNLVKQLIELDEWYMLASGKFLAQCAYTKDVAFIMVYKGSSTQIFKTGTPGAYTPSFSAVPGTLFTGAMNGFDISPDGSRMVAWSANKVYEWTEDEPTWTLKGTFTGNIVYAFVK